MGIRVLDCTLRDGAYVTEGSFGENCIKNIIKNLNQANIDIIECGWLSKKKHNNGNVFFNTPYDIEKYKLNNNSKLALMFDFGKYNPDNLETNSGIIDIIRIAFHKENLDKISFTLFELKSKGYKVFLQPSNIMEYSKNDIKKLCKQANSSEVDALYIVDSYGSMFPEDLDKIMPLFAENTNENIELGFHSHNNIQLAFGLSIQFINHLKPRNIIIDSSLCGLGRGAGNTKTELLIHYLNKQGAEYKPDFIWKIIEEDINPFYSKFNWEYNSKRGLSGIMGLHPDR